MKPCYNVIIVPLPDKSDPYGQVTRVERAGITCGNKFNEVWGKHFPPYANWNRTSPYNAFNPVTKVWEFDVGVWRRHREGKGDRYVYDPEQRAGSTHVRDLLDGPVNITSPAEVTMPVYATGLTDSFAAVSIVDRGTVPAPAPASAPVPAPPSAPAPVSSPASKSRKEENDMEEAELRKYLVQRVPSQWIVCLIMMMLLCRQMRRRSIWEDKGGQGSTSKAAEALLASLQL